MQSLSLNTPFIHLFKTVHNFYLYDVNKNMILKTNKNIYEFFKNNFRRYEDFGNSEKLTTEEKEAIKLMVNAGFLSNRRIKEVLHPSDNILQYYMQSKLNKITLQVTQQCNLRCSYCPYSGSYINRRHANKAMSIETAKKGIDYLITHSKDSSRINVGFYGGEPLIEFNLIKECLEYAGKKADCKEISFSITTNATLLNDEIIKVFEQYNVQLVISLDGPRNIHDKNRKFALNSCGSFDKVTRIMEHIKNKYPNYYRDNIKFNVVIDPMNDFSCANDFFTSYELVKDSNLTSTLINTEYMEQEINYSEDYLTKVSYEIFKIYLLNLKRLKKENVSKLIEAYFSTLIKVNDQLIPQKSLPDKMHHSGPCIPGALRLFMSIDGTLYPCERVSELSTVMKIGHVNDGLDIEKVRKLLNIGKLTEQSCKNCWAIRFCNMCAVSADNIDSLSSEKKQARCKSVISNVEENFKDLCVMKELNKNSLITETNILSTI